MDEFVCVCVCVCVGSGRGLFAVMAVGAVWVYRGLRDIRGWVC